MFNLISKRNIIFNNINKINKNIKKRNLLNILEKKIYNNEDDLYYNNVNKIIIKDKLTGADKIFYELFNQNVEYVFMVSGGAIMPLVDKFYNNKMIKYIVNAHEQNSVHAATGYARSSNKTGVVITTSGPGLTNAITGMLDATNDSTPLVVLSGQVSLDSVGKQSFQECDAVNLSKSATKWSYQVKPDDDIQQIINKAFFIANDKKKGAVHIDLPKCILSKNNNELNNSNELKIKNKENNNINHLNFNDLGNLINNSESPVLYIGQGCSSAYLELRRLAEKGNIYVTNTIHANGIMDTTHDLSLKFLGMHGYPVANHAIQNSDCIIAIGSRFDDRTIGNASKYAPKAYEAFKNKKGGIISCNLEESEFNKSIKPHYTYNLSSSEFINKLLPHIKYKKRDNWKKKIEDWKINYPITFKNNDNILRSEYLISEINNYLKNKYITNFKITTGVGNHQMQTSQFIDFREPNQMISSGSLGVMGFGLPAAIGVKLGNPENLVIDIDGDSSFLMTLSDLKTIVENNIDIKIFIINNKSQAMVTAWEKLFYDGRVTATINKRNPEFYKLAQSFGIKSLKCDKKEDVINFVNNVLNSKGPFLGEFICEPDYCFPLIPPGNALDDMIFSETKIDYQLPPG